MQLFPMKTVVFKINFNLISLSIDDCAVRISFFTCLVCSHLDGKKQKRTLKNAGGAVVGLFAREDSILGFGFSFF